MKRTWLLVGGGILLFALLYGPGLLGVGTGQLLAFLLVLLCPLMHFFMGHGGHGHAGGEAPKEPAPGPQALSASEGEETAGSPR